MNATAASPAAVLQSIGQICVNVRDLGRAVSFWRDKLGVKYLFEAPKMAFFDCGGLRVMLGLPETPEFDHPSSVLYFRVGDIAAAHARLAAAGVPFRRPPALIAKMPDHELWMAFFDDSE